MGTLQYFNKTHRRKDFSDNGLPKETSHRRSINRGTHVEEYAISNRNELFIVNHKNGHRPKKTTNQHINEHDSDSETRIRSEISSAEKFNSDVNPKDFTSEQAQAITPVNTEFNLIDKSNNIVLQIWNCRSNLTKSITIGEQTRTWWMLETNARKAPGPFGYLKDAKRLPNPETFGSKLIAA